LTGFLVLMGIGELLSLLQPSFSVASCLMEYPYSLQIFAV
jgi:hypothetical protein